MASAQTVYGGTAFRSKAVNDSLAVRVKQFLCRVVSGSRRLRRLLRSSGISSRLNGCLPALVCSILIFPIIVRSDEFGKNKVIYHHFAWKCLTTAHFTIHYYEKQGDVPFIVEDWAEKIYSDLSSKFTFHLRSRIPLIIYDGHTHFRQTNVIGMLLPEGVNGFTTQLHNRVVVPFDGSYRALRQVLHHELVHAFQYGILFDQFGSAFIAATAMQMPLWFSEGLAEYLSRNWTNDDDMFLLDAVMTTRLPSSPLQLSGYLAYKAGQCFIKYLAESRGTEAFSLFLNRFRQTKNVDKSIRDIYGMSADTLWHAWHDELKRRYWPELGKRHNDRTMFPAVQLPAGSAASFATKPRLSPNGDKIAYYSDHHDYTRILVTDRDGHLLFETGRCGSSYDFESFHPFKSGIAWSPDGTALAFVVNEQGEDEIRIVNTITGKANRRIRPHVAAIYGIDWSPMDSSIVFAVSDSGRSDLMLFNPNTMSLKKITTDRAYEADPRFSRDGTAIFYSRSDAYTGQSPAATGDSRSVRQLWKFDCRNGATTQVTFSPCNKKAPCFTADGSDILYISDACGIDNVVRADIRFPDSASPVTDIIGMAADPDCAAKSPVAVFSLFQKGIWQTRFFDLSLPDTAADPSLPTQWALSCADTTRPFFPLSDTTLADSARFKIDTSNKNGRKRSLRSMAAQRDTFRLPHDYRVHLVPDHLGFSIGASSRFGVYGQVAAAYSDLLGDHHFSIMGDVKGNFTEYAHLHLTYLNLSYRPNFGGSVFLSREYTSRRLSPDSIYSDASGGIRLLLRYPFSTLARCDIELRALQRIRTPATFDTEAGYHHLPGREKLESFSLLPEVSFTYDDILWSVTGPRTGTRGHLRIVCSPALPFVDRQFLSFDVDVRRYLHLPCDITWANRIAFGASISLDNGTPARKFFIGGNENWFLFDYAMCNRDGYEKNIHNMPYSQTIVPFRGWGYFSLIGDRFTIVNSELRFPFIDEVVFPFPLPFSCRHIGGALFCDAGNAWDKSDQRGKVPLPDEIFGGFGFGLRANLGFFIIRFDRAWKTDWKSTPGPVVNYWSLGTEF